MHVFFIAHSQIRKFEQPDQSGSYDRYELKLSKQCAPLLKEWCDMLLFASYETNVVELDGKKKAVGGRERVMYSSHTAAWDAKNRHGFVEKLPFVFASIAGVFQKQAAAGIAMRMCCLASLLKLPPVEAMTFEQIANHCGVTRAAISKVMLDLSTITGIRSCHQRSDATRVAYRQRAIEVHARRRKG